MICTGFFCLFFFNFSTAGPQTTRKWDPKELHKLHSMRILVYPLDILGGLIGLFANSVEMSEAVFMTC